MLGIKEVAINVRSSEKKPDRTLSSFEVTTPNSQNKFVIDITGEIKQLYTEKLA